ncbi:hypothetical protein PR048_000396 [Dryococelus australis]|uniref:Uncharacterized protein n=1 Tax=Dryococelus australis TaxID=614101 RepID=A0ABQ9IFD6_9NEOP|nr:hypothetical protein PR048_000396 [Dryococelus australis]
MLVIDFNMAKFQRLHEKDRPDDKGFVLVSRRGTKASPGTKDSVSPAMRQTAARKPVQVGIRNSMNIKTVPKLIKPRTKAIFVSRFAPEVQEDDIVSYINQELKVSNLKVAKL